MSTYTPIDEQETIIIISRDSDTAEVCTTDTTMWTKLDKLVSDPDSDWKLSRIALCRGEETERIYTAPKSLISFRTSKRTYRALTDEQKAQAAERLRKAREARKNNIKNI